MKFFNKVAGKAWNLCCAPGNQWGNCHTSISFGEKLMPMEDYNVTSLKFHNQEPRIHLQTQRILLLSDELMAAKKRPQSRKKLFVKWEIQQNFTLHVGHWLWKQIIIRLLLQIEVIWCLQYMCTFWIMELKPFRILTLHKKSFFFLVIRSS